MGPCGGDHADGVSVRPGGGKDAAVAGLLHATQIPDGFLSFLGPAFLTRLYRRVVATPGHFLLVAAEGDRVVGFVAGSTDVRGLYRTFLLHDGVPAGGGAAGRLLRGWRRALETLRHGAGAGTGRGVELLAIAVDPDRQGRGTGRHLVTGFLDAVRSGGGGAAYVVVAADNDRAVGLYRGAGFVAGPPFELHAGTSSLVMQWDEGRSAATESRS